MTVPETHELTVPLFLEKGTDLLSADVWIRYDTSCVEHTEVSRTALTSEFRLVWHASGGLLKIALYGTREVNNRGSILDIGFRMKADAAGPGSLKWEVIRINDQPFTSHMTTLVLDPAETHTSSPLRFGLLDSYPNPFNPSTRIRYELDGAGLVSIAVFDIMGRHVKTLKHAEEDAGAYEVLWDGKDSGGVEVTSGMYLVQLVRGRDMDSIRILKAK